MNSRDEQFEPESIEEQINRLQMISQTAGNAIPDARMVKDLKHIYTDHTQSGERVWMRLAERVAQQNEALNKAQLLTNEIQTERSTPMQVEQFDTRSIPRVKPPRKIGRISTLVAALLIAAVLVGSTLWVLAIHSNPRTGSRDSTPVQRQTPGVTTASVLYDLTTQGLYAFEANTGKQLWHSSAITAGYAPIVSGDTVYADDGSNLYAFDRQHGTLRWQFAYGGHPVDSNNTNSKLLIGQHRIYLVEGTDVFASAGPQYGQGGVQSPPITPTPSTLFAFEPTTGKLLWQHTLGYRLNDPVIEGDMIYGIGSTTMNGNLYALKGSDGAVLWQQPLAQTSKLYYGFQAVSGTLYFASTSNTAQSQLFLYAYALSNGQERWQSQPMYDNNTYNITVAGNALYYRVGDHNLYAFNAQNGRVLWMHTVPALISNYALPVADGLLYAVTQKDLNNPPYNLQAFNTSSGQQVWSHQLSLSGSAITWLMASHNRLYVYSNDMSGVPDKMTIFNPATGVPITSYALPTDAGISKLVLAAA